MNERVWVINEIDGQAVEKLSAEAGISTLLARVFLSRGISDCAYIKRFLSPSSDEMHDPFLLKDMDAAVERIIRAVSAREKICIYGDYDVDGVTGTSVLLSFLKEIGSDACFYIPDRLDEGYGLSVKALDRIKEEGASLVVTVDCGISALEEVRHATGSKLDIIVTDHHKCTEELPEAIAVINPCRPDCGYPFKELAGVGVTYKLLNALSIRLGLGDAHKRYLDLVALGTIADVVPLTGENRYIAREGITMLRSTGNPGLKAMLECTGLAGKPLNSFSVSYVLAPRINAAGRIGDAGRAVRLFTTDDGSEAAHIASSLNEENKVRQETENAILQEAIDAIEADKDRASDKVLVVCGAGWHHGVVGIVASRITERYYRPAIMLSNEGGVCKGSGRSIDGFNLFDALTECADLLERYGGHEKAAGLTLDASRLEDFRKRINSYADRVLDEDVLIPKVKPDAYIDREDITIENVAELEKLAPFGVGNREPLFAYKGLKLIEVRTAGESKHLRLKFEDRGRCFEGIGYRMGSFSSEYYAGDTVDAAFTLEINTWNSHRDVQFNIKDLKPPDEVIARNIYYYNLDKRIEAEGIKDYNIDYGQFRGDLTEIIPERGDLAAVYKFIKETGGREMDIDDLFALSKKIARSSKIRMNYFKLKKSIEIFSELKLLNYTEAGKYGLRIIIRDEIKGKTKLENSLLYRRLQALKGEAERSVARRL